MHPTNVNLPDLPQDILYDLLPYLPLQSLIAARGVCRTWHHAAELADIHPIRRELLNIYLDLIDRPWFLDSRKWPLENLRDFDRQAYLDTLLAQYNWLPEDFSMWILEWPARATFGWVWPGLPSDDFSGETTFHRLSGVNTLGIIPPEVGAVFLVYPRDEEEMPDGNPKERPDDFVAPALLVWEDPDDHQVWLMLGDSAYRGKVAYSHDFGVMSLPLGLDFSLEGTQVEMNWLEWMRALSRRLSRSMPASCHALVPMIATPRQRPPFIPWVAPNRSLYFGTSLKVYSLLFQVTNQLLVTGVSS
ncbi:hypothetical protein HGRIS_005275 [Hohenbuehelia grisea]|uniref:F-box domain-containing protein n=1 Tax=Hohenbuehelia grisea TaxID=104357 RepID=A0ABR3JF94_9AGAR